jgi:hypothetical protein
MPWARVDLCQPEDHEIDHRCRRILLEGLPLRAELSLPPWLLVRDPDGDFRLRGEFVGCAPKDSFEQSLRDLMQIVTSTTLGFVDKERGG